MASSYFSSDDNGGFIIFSGNKPWYSSKDNVDLGVSPKPKSSKALTKVRASAKNKRIIEFPFFDELIKFEKDSYWQNVFDDAAQGKFPRNFKFQNGVLTYKLRSKNIDQSIPKEPEEAIAILKKFFLNTASLISPQDIRKNKADEDKIQEDKEDLPDNLLWHQIRSEKQKLIMISLYVEKLGDDYSLSIEERKGLMQNIKIGMLAGYLNGDNIIFSGNSIDKIDGLVYDKSTRRLVIDKESCNLAKIKNKHQNLYSSGMPEESLGNESYSLDESKSFASKNLSKQDLIKNWSRFVSDFGKKK
jgi:hypothetical protein